MITIWWIIFSIITAYLVFINVYRDTTSDLSLLLKDNDEKTHIIGLINSFIFSFLYGILGPVGLLCLLFIKKDLYYNI